MICDASEGDCAHNTHRYLEDIVYHKTTAGFVVPAHERARWDAAPLRVEPKPKPNEAECDIDEVVAELGDVFYLDAPLEARLRSAHHDEPLRVSRLAAATLSGAADGSLHTPAAFLAKRLAGIEHGKTKAP